ncbi:MAG: hypothetical protein ABW076_02375 [Candidatus Thiodiazotropha sp.]
MRQGWPQAIRAAVMLHLLPSSGPPAGRVSFNTARSSLQQCFIQACEMGMEGLKFKSWAGRPHFEALAQD